MNVIPLPLSVQLEKGTFPLARRFLVYCEDDVSRGVASFLVSEAEKRYGLIGQLHETEDRAPSIVLRLERDVDFLQSMRGHEEGYTLSVTEEGIFILAENRSGLFYGVQSFFQLLPISLEIHTQEDIHIPCMRVCLLII